MEHDLLRTPQVFLHADDLGMNQRVTDGILAGFTEGLLTSTSLLANAPAFEYAISRWGWLEEERESGRLASAAKRRMLNDDGTDPFDLGVHLNLTQGSPLTPGFPKELLDNTGRFPGVGRIFSRLFWGADHWRAAIQQELSAQIERVIESGLKPTHLNGHQYVELMPGVADILVGLAERYQIHVIRVALERRVGTALRGNPRPISNWCLAHVKRCFASRFRKRIDQRRLHHTDHFCGTAHAGCVSLNVLRKFVAGLPRHTNLEVGLHPGMEPTEVDLSATAAGWIDPLANLRPQELAMLQSPDTVQMLASERLSLSRLANLSRSD